MSPTRPADAVEILILARDRRPDLLLADITDPVRRLRFPS